MSRSSENQPILTITTSKNWVLPPRPKNVRKNKSSSDKKKSKQRSESEQDASPSDPVKEEPKTELEPEPETKDESSLDSPEHLASSIKLINHENYQLKTKLLSLIHDYKSLKTIVNTPTSTRPPPVELLFSSPSTARKRVYPEINDPMNDLISDMSGLSHTSPGSVVSPVDEEADPGFEMELFNFINLEQYSLDNIDEVLAEIRDEDDDDEMDLTSLSRSSSPTSDSDENSLMTTLTRSTTVSTTSSFAEKKSFSQQFKFHDLPEFSEEEYAFSFEKLTSHDKMMSVIEEDQYNQVADFLEEKLMSNDVQYYVEKSQQVQKLGRDMFSES